MSLKVWLPLTGTLKNNGTSNSVVTVSGATVNTSGKIGSCYSFDGSDDYISISDSALYSIFKGGSTPFSIAMWVYHADSTRAILFGDYGLSGSISFNVELYTGHGVRFYWNANPDYNTTISVGGSTWTHIAITYDGSNLRSYQNGTLVNTRAGTLAAMNKTSGVFYLGRDSRTGTTVLNGRLNDFRIYDNCLSTAEVKELAQGLVLHCRFNNCELGNKNLHKNSNLLSTSWSLNQATVSNGVVTISPTTDSDRRMYQMPANGDWSWSANTVYTASVEARSDNGGKLVFQPFGGNTSGSPAINTTKGWKRYSYTFTTGSSPTTGSMTYMINQTADATLQLRKPKLELGSKMTSWCPNASDALAKPLSVADITVNDNSGYNYPITITGSPAVILDTVRNDTSLHFSATSQKCNVTGLDTSVFGNSYSIAWWGKCATFSNVMQWGFSNGIRLNGIYNGTLWNTGDGSNNPLYTPGTTTQVSAPSVNEWHHFVMTGDGTTCKVYKDGVHWATAKTYKAISGTSIYFNGWDSGTSYSNSDLSISDFRMYATTLSAADVLDLYRSYTKVAKPKQLMVYTFTEDGATAGITTNGVTHNEHLLESDARYNIVTSFSYKPAANTSNSCINTAIADFEIFRNIGKPMSFHVECDVAWSNWGWGSGGTTRLIFQGSNRKIATGTFAWEGTNYIAGWDIKSNVSSAASGSVHLSKTTTIPATWFDTYDASYFGMRCDYSDGNGTVSVTNFKVTLDTDNTKFSSKYFASDELIEI